MERKATHNIEKAKNYLAVLLLLSFVFLMWGASLNINSVQTGTLKYTSNHKDTGLRGNTTFFFIERTFITSIEIRDVQRHILRKSIQRIPFFRRHFNTSIKKEHILYTLNPVLALLISSDLIYPEEDDEPPSIKA